ncbi:T9SS type A sorting domain-containing protein [Chryseobacterium sp. DT-3]|uniref:T9SS type A sorting domain-containing protein n=1 Tax=Chryseobacterium sp. DT-3 TaxID=3396164 RepID=UPI003F1D0734
MKKIFTILGITSCVFGFSQNLVQNPSFESGVSSWTAGTGTSYTLPTVETDTPYQGLNYAKYVATATNGFYQNIPISANTQYVVSFWYKSSGSGNGARIWSCFLDASAAPVYLTSDASTDPLRNNNGYLAKVSVWTQKTVTFTSPASAAQFQLQVRAYNNSTASFDEFSLIQNGSLSTIDFSSSKYSLVKNTFVKSEINFAKNCKDVKIFNMFGQVVKSLSVKENETVNVDELAKGNYIVTGTVNNEPVSQKILKD